MFNRKNTLAVITDGSTLSRQKILMGVCTYALMGVKNSAGLPFFRLLTRLFCQRKKR